MDFASRRENAISIVKKKLREKLHTDQVLIHLYRSVNAKNGIDYWLQAVVPELKDAKKEVAKKGKDAWDPEGIGAAMNDEHWKLLVDVIKEKDVDVETYIQDIAPNLSAVCGSDTAAQLICGAGGLEKLSRMTQRDCQSLGDEAGQFGGPSKKSILESHELATSDRALRILASRSILAARIDAHNGEFKGDKLHQEVLYAQ